MRSLRHLSVVFAIAALISVDAFVAAQAGAAVESMPGSPAVVAVRATRPATSSRPKAKPVPRRRPKVAATVRVTKPPLRPAMPKIAAPKPAATFAVTPSTDCAGVVASVVWPPAWRAICAGGRPGLLGLTSSTGTTTLYVRPGESAALLRTVALHEAGHAWNFSHLNPDKIAQWCSSRGCDAAHFFSGGAHGPGWSEPGGAEDWAASWDVCHGGEYHRSYLGLAPPNAAQCALQNSLVGYPT
jgi:hypothetical protein